MEEATTTTTSATTGGVEHDKSQSILECVGEVCEIQPPVSRHDGDAAAGKPKRAPKTSKASSSGSSSKVIQTLHSQQDLSAVLDASSKDDSTVIVEFMTTWCGACKGIAPLYEELALEFSEHVQAA